MTRVLPSLAGALLIALLPACASAPFAGPPELRVGRDQCAECGMIISDDRCAGALLTEEPGGHREHELFDDIGCLLDRMKSEQGKRVVSVYVYDYAQRRWLAASDAWIVADAGVHTPMGSGLVAMGDKPAAEKLASQGKGRVVPGAELGSLKSR